MPDILKKAFQLAGIIAIGFCFEPGKCSAQNDTAIDKGWIISTTDTGGRYTPAYLANGIIGIRSDRTGLSPASVHINGLYDRSADRDNVRLVTEYNPLQLKIIFNSGVELKIDNNVTSWRQALNLKEAILETSYNYGSSLRVKTQLAALQNLPVAAIGVYEFTAVNDIEFTIQNSISIPERSYTAAIYRPLLNYHIYRLSSQATERLPILSARFPTESGTSVVAGANTYYFDGPAPEMVYTKTADSLSQALSFKVHLKKGEQFSFCMLSAFQHSNLSSDPYNDAIRISSREYNLGYRHKLEAHKKRWAKLWESDVVIEGDDEAQITLRQGIYCLYSSIAEGFGLSIPSAGLDNEWGAHIFWDADMWMYPGLLVLHPQLALSMMDFRYNTLLQAKKRAAQFGYKGAMYPWESDLDGNENTSINYKLDMTEHHITADIAIAAWNYYQVTDDKRWLKEKGFPMIKEIAAFWLSRVIKDAAGKYHINNVVGTDEYAEDINDDAFTNAVAAIALKAAVKAAMATGEPVNPLWQTVAANIVVLKHKDSYTLQNETYHGQMIKQADVNLLAFPLEVITDKSRILKDLEYYEPVINPKGPSMSYSVLAGAYARIGKTAKAYELFTRAYRPNVKPPFNIVSERSTNNITPFCTAYGGLLQTVLFGFGGLRITEAGLVQGPPKLPPHWKKLTIKRSGFRDIVCIGKQ